MRGEKRRGPVESFCGKVNDYYYNFCQYCVPSNSSVAEEGSCPLEALKLSVKLSGCLSEAMRLSWIFWKLCKCLSRTQ